MSTGYNGYSARPRRRPLSPRQERIVRRLLTQVGPGPAAFFRDACNLMSEEPPRPAVTHLVAHLLGDIFSSWESVLGSEGLRIPGTKDRKKAKIRTILTELGIS